MTKDRSTRTPEPTKRSKAGRTLSQRLLQALTGEIRALEQAVGKTRPAAADAAGRDDGGAGAVAGAKARIDAIGNLTRTLDKLLELARLEGQAAKNEAIEDGEAERLRIELVKRLRALDAKRRSGRRLFDDPATGTPAASPA